jgi:hypothetical protein
MKFLPTPDSARRHLHGEDALGQGLEAAVTLVLFLGLGYLLDRWLGTAPWFTVGMVGFAGVGVFVIMKAKYMARMEQLEAERREAAARRPSPSPATRSTVATVPSVTTIGDPKRALP